MSKKRQITYILIVAVTDANMTALYNDFRLNGSYGLKVKTCRKMKKLVGRTR